MNFFGNFSVFPFFPVTFQRISSPYLLLFSITSFFIYIFYFLPFFSRKKSEKKTMNDGKTQFTARLRRAEWSNFPQQPFDLGKDFRYAAADALHGDRRRFRPGFSPPFSAGERRATRVLCRQTGSGDTDTSDPDRPWCWWPTAR